MKNLILLNETLQEQKISTENQTQLKGGGWGSGTKSNGRGCPPPDIMNEKSWSDNSMFRAYDCTVHKP